MSMLTDSMFLFKASLKEEGHDQKHQSHPDHLDARAARIELCYSLIRFQVVCGKSFAERVLQKEFAERVKLVADQVTVLCGLSNRSGGTSCSLCEKSFAERVRNWQVSRKDGLLLQQEGVPCLLHHRCQSHTHQQPLVKGEPSPERNDRFVVP